MPDWWWNALALALGACLAMLLADTITVPVILLIGVADLAVDMAVLR